MIVIYTVYIAYIVIILHISPRWIILLVFGAWLLLYGGNIQVSPGCHVCECDALLMLLWLMIIGFQTGARLHFLHIYYYYLGSRDTLCTYGSWRMHYIRFIHQIVQVCF